MIQVAPDRHGRSHGKKRELVHVPIGQELPQARQDPQEPRSPEEPQWGTATPHGPHGKSRKTHQPVHVQMGQASQDPHERHHPEEHELGAATIGQSPPTAFPLAIGERRQSKDLDNTTVDKRLETRALGAMSETVREEM